MGEGEWVGGLRVHAPECLGKDGEVVVEGLDGGLQAGLLHLVQRGGGGHHVELLHHPQVEARREPVLHQVDGPTQVPPQRHDALHHHPVEEEGRRRRVRGVERGAEEGEGRGRMAGKHAHHLEV